MQASLAAMAIFSNTCALCAMPPLSLGSAAPLGYGVLNVGSQEPPRHWGSTCYHQGWEVPGSEVFLIMSIVHSPYWIHNNKQQATMPTFTVTHLSWSVFLGWSRNTRVSNELGAGRPEIACYAARVTFWPLGRICLVRCLPWFILCHHHSFDPNKTGRIKGNTIVDFQHRVSKTTSWPWNSWSLGSSVLSWHLC